MSDSESLQAQPDLRIDSLSPRITSWFLEKDDPKIKIDYSDVAKFIASVSGVELSRYGLMRALNDEIAYAPHALIERLVNRERYDQDQECFKVVVSFLVKGLLPSPLLASSILSIFAEQDGMELTRQILTSESAAGDCLKWSLDQIQEMSIFICFGCSKVLTNKLYFLHLPPSEGTAEECILCGEERKTGRRMSIAEHGTVKRAYQHWTNGWNEDDWEQFFDASDTEYASLSSLSEARERNGAGCYPYLS